VFFSESFKIDRVKMSGKEVIVLGSEEDKGVDESPAFITILKAALAAERGDGAPEPPLTIRFNDLSTADLFVKVMPNGPILSLNKSILQVYPFFDSFQNVSEVNGYVEITAPDPETCAFVIECLYIFSTDERVIKLDDVLVQGFVDEVIKRKFLSVLRNASFFMTDKLLSRCYLLFVLAG
jgi:hypothetical protein